MKSNIVNKNIHKIIPGGGHTYSKGDDQFPENAPKIITNAKGVYCWDLEKNKYMDWAMGNRVMILGHSYDKVDNSVIDAIKKGVNYTRPSLLEYELADYLTNLWPSAEMVKFGKNGSDVTTAAIKLSRAYTNRKYILVCRSHPFFSTHDWFIGSTEMNCGTLESERVFTLHFDYNNVDEVDELFSKYQNKIAAVILEPVKNDSPYFNPNKSDLTKDGILQRSSDNYNFLYYLRKKTKESGSVLIFDEMISGMRFDIKGVHHLYGIYPDLVTFGKAVANGYSCSILAGRKDLMELGGIHHKKERVFLLSQTHASETTGLAAAMATLQECERLGVSEYIWTLGAKLKFDLNKLIKGFGLDKYIKVIGFDANPQILCIDGSGIFWPELHTLMHQFLIEKKVLIPWISITFSHTEKHLNETMDAFAYALVRLKKSIDESRVDDDLMGPAIKPVFRKWN